MSPRRPRRSYGQYCALARGLDLVGDRWTLLVVRELLAGPRRYTELHADLPGVSTDMLASRLKDMERDGLAERRRLPPPGAAYVYELTPRGRELLPAVTALAAWGAAGLAERRPTDAVRTHWAALPLRARLEQATGAGSAAGAGRAVGEDGVAGSEGTVVDVRLDESVFHIRLGDTTRRPPYSEGPADAPDAALAMDADTCARLADGSLSLAEAVTSGVLRVEGDTPVARTLRATTS